MGQRAPRNGHSCQRCPPFGGVSGPGDHRERCRAIRSFYASRGRFYREPRWTCLGLTLRPLPGPTRPGHRTRRTCRLQLSGARCDRPARTASPPSSATRSRRHRSSARPSSSPTRRGRAAPRSGPRYTACGSSMPATSRTARPANAIVQSPCTIRPGSPTRRANSSSRWIAVVSGRSGVSDRLVVGDGIRHLANGARPSTSRRWSGARSPISSSVWLRGRTPSRTARSRGRRRVSRS